MDTSFLTSPSPLALQLLNPKPPDPAHAAEIGPVDNDAIDTQHNLTIVPSPPARFREFSFSVRVLPPAAYYFDRRCAEIIFNYIPPRLRDESSTPRCVVMSESRQIAQRPRDTHIHVLHENPLEDNEERFNTSDNQFGAKKPVQLLLTIDQTRRQKRKRPYECEVKIEELQKEVHQAWIAVQAGNQQNEDLQNEIHSKWLQEHSLSQTVQEQSNEKHKWSMMMLEITMKFQFLKQEYAVLAKQFHECVSSFPAAMQMIGENVQALADEHDELKKKFVRQSQDLRLCYNQLLEMKGNIRVFCRCRPLSITEVNTGSSSILDFKAGCNNELVVCPNGGARKIFKFDCVFAPTDTQVDVFIETAPVVVSALDGYNVCIFAYGQTGTGKTFTMEGTEDNRGVNYRTLEELFRVASERKGQFEYYFSVSALEVYNEQIRDLLVSPHLSGQNNKKLEIKQVAEGVHQVPGLTEAKVHCLEEAWKVLQTGSSARTVGSTNANERSSRSHCMLCVVVKGENLLTGECSRSKLWLVDLAGSERVAKTDVHGERLKEAQSINKSLSALADVIYALVTKSSHVPYRNSKLTQLLQDSLGGEAKTLMFVQISPSEHDAGETLCSLNFASRVRGVELGPARKQVDLMEVAKYKNLVEKCKQEAKSKDESLKKLQVAVRVKEQTCRALSEKVRGSEGIMAVEKKARSIAESKLREQQQKMKEQQLLNEKQQELIEKLKEQLKAKGDCWASEEPVRQGRRLEEESARRQPLREMVVEKGYNCYSPAMRVPSRRPARASFCEVPRGRPSIAGMAGKLFSSERLQDENENHAPNAAPLSTLMATPMPSSSWRRSLAPNVTMLGGSSIPRIAQFKSPMPPKLGVLQCPAWDDGPPPPLPVADRGLLPPPAPPATACAGRVLEFSKKARRATMTSPCPRPPPPPQWVSASGASSSGGGGAAAASSPLCPLPPVAPTLVGGAQRVLVGNNRAKPNNYKRGGWNHR